MADVALPIAGVAEAAGAGEFVTIPLIEAEIAALDAELLALEAAAMNATVVAGVEAEVPVLGWAAAGVTLVALTAILLAIAAKTSERNRLGGLAPPKTISGNKILTIDASPDVPYGPHLPQYGPPGKPYGPSTQDRYRASFSFPRTFRRKYRNRYGDVIYV